LLHSRLGQQTVTYSGTTALDYAGPTHLDRLELALLGAQLPPPCGLGLGENLDTRLELVELFPAIVELLAEVVQFLDVTSLGIFDPLIKVCLDLTERFEPTENQIVEDSEVRERFCLTLLLQANISSCWYVSKIQVTYSLVRTEDPIHVLIDGEQQGVPLCKLITMHLVCIPKLALLLAETAFQRL
jgi:hypothetical protein